MKMSTKKSVPKCSRCRNHGFTAERKGHSGKCPFLACLCWKCSLITERTKIMANQRRIRRIISTESAAASTSVTTGAERPARPPEPAAYRSSQESAGVYDPALILAHPQQSPYSGEMLATPLPFLLCYHPGFLVSHQQPPPGPPPGEAIGFPTLLHSMPRQPQVVQDSQGRDANPSKGNPNKENLHEC